MEDEKQTQAQPKKIKVDNTELQDKLLALRAERERLSQDIRNDSVLSEWDHKISEIRKQLEAK
jgi:hypothetical protein